MASFKSAGHPPPRLPWDFFLKPLWKKNGSLKLFSGYLPGL
jgi:hypothetical protein